MKISSHERNSCINGLNSIEVNGKTCFVRGLLKPLKHVFYPTFKRPKFVRGNSSKKIGLRVHKEVEKWAKGRPVKRPHRFTKQILAQLRALRLEPTEPEVHVLSRHGAFLTRSDLICHHVGKEDVVVVSLKTGSNLGYTRGQGMLKGLPGIKNCVKNHHQLQLASEVACIEQEYKISVKTAVVIYAGFGKKKSCRVDPLLPWAKTKTFRRALMQALHSDAVSGGVLLP